MLTAAITQIVLYEHFFYLHKFVAEAHTLAAEYALPGTHPLYRMLHPHTFNVLQQNINAAYALFDSAPGTADGMPCNFFALEADSYQTVISKAYASYSAGILLKTMTTVPNSSLSEDCARFLGTFRDYVSRYVDALYGAENDAQLDDDSDAQKFYRILTDMVPGTPPDCTRQSL